jgi:hypothetical protein
MIAKCLPVMMHHPLTIILLPLLPQLQCDAPQMHPGRNEMVLSEGIQTQVVFLGIGFYLNIYRHALNISSSEQCTHEAGFIAELTYETLSCHYGLMHVVQYLLILSCVTS